MSRRPPGRRVTLAGVWLACCLASTWSCGGGASRPTAPTTPALDLSRTDTPLDLSAERYLLQLIGNDLSDDPALPPCSPIVVPRGGKFVTTFLWFRWEGDELVGRSRPPYAATLEIRLRRVSSSILGVVVGGTVTGAAPDEYDRILGQRDTTFSAEGGSVGLSGLVSPRIRDDALGPTLSGWMRGPLRSGIRPGRSPCAPTRSTTWNRRDRAAHTTTRRCRVRAGASRSEAIGAVAPRNGAGVPTARRPGSASSGFSLISLAISRQAPPGTAVALREAVTNRWAVGNQKPI